MSELFVEVHEGPGTVNAAEWHGLFADHPDSWEWAKLVYDCGMEGMQFLTLQVRDGEKTILLLPLFDVRFPLATLLEGRLARLAAALPGNTLSPRLLGVGLVEGEWGQAGCAADAPAETLNAAWRLAQASLWKLMRQRRAGLLVFLNFTPQAAGALPRELAKKLAAIDTIPCARLPIDFANTDEYLAKLSKNTRKDIRRKLTDAKEIRIERPPAAGEHVERIHDLYLQTIHRAPLSLGIQRKEFFRRITGEVPGAHYVLYFAQERLLAFNLLIRRDGALIDKYFCMEEAAGREKNLYFVSWMENVAYCCREGLKLYHAGPGAEATKARLGAKFIPSITLFRHRLGPVQAMLRLMRPLIAYKPAVALDETGEDDAGGAAGGAGANLIH